jgi:hypothetical protein
MSSAAPTTGRTWARQLPRLGYRTRRSPQARDYLRVVAPTRLRYSPVAVGQTKTQFEAAVTTIRTRPCRATARGSNRASELATDCVGFTPADHIPLIIKKPPGDVTVTVQCPLEVPRTLRPMPDPVAICRVLALPERLRVPASPNVGRRTSVPAAHATGRGPARPVARISPTQRGRARRRFLCCARRPHCLQRHGILSLLAADLCPSRSAPRTPAGSGLRMTRPVRTFRTAGGSRGLNGGGGGGGGESCKYIRPPSCGGRRGDASPGVLAPARPGHPSRARSSAHAAPPRPRQAGAKPQDEHPNKNVGDTFMEHGFGHDLGCGFCPPIRDCPDPTLPTSMRIHEGPHARLRRARAAWSAHDALSTASDHHIVSAMPGSIRCVATREGQALCLPTS